MAKKRKVLITGSEGYIGSVLVKKLLQQEIPFDGLDTAFYGKKSFGKKYHLIQKDLRNIKEIDLRPYSVVIHLAALSNDPMGELNPNLTNEINYKATVALAKKAKEQGVKRFIFSSSCSIYGIAENGIVNEKSKTNPLTAYAKSKIAVENALIELADNDFCVCLLRNSTVYGYSPSFRNDLVVNNLTSCVYATNKIKMMSDGTPWRPLIDVRDLSDIFIAFVKARAQKVNKQIFNIGFDENNFQVKQITEYIQKYLNNSEVEFTGEHGKDTRSYKVDFSKFKKAFPQIKKRWPIDKSIKDLLVQLKKINFTRNEFLTNKYARITILKQLLDDKLVDSNLFWKIR